MAPATPKGRSGQNAKKPLIKPVLPALPVLAKKNKPAPVTVAELPPEELPSPTDRLGSSGNIEVAGTPDEVSHRVNDAQVEGGASTLNGAEAKPAQANASVQELDGQPQTIITEEDTASDNVAELADANEVSAATEDSSYHNSIDYSNRSAVSAEDSSQNHQTSAQYNSGNESQPWSDDANNTSQPTSVELVHDPPDDVHLNGSAHTYAGNSAADKVGSSDSHDNVSDIPIREDESKNLENEIGMANGTQHDSRQPEVGNQQYPTPVSNQHSRAGSIVGSHIPSISDHLLQLSTSKMWADWMITVNSRGLHPFMAYAHGIVLIRSTRLTRLMDRQPQSQFGGNAISLQPPRVIVPHAFEAALRFLYSDTVLSSAALVPKQPAANLRAVRASLLDYLLSYWVSGIELGLEPIVTCSARLLDEFINWDVVEAVMKEALELDSISWRASDERAGVSLDYAALALQLKQTVLNFIAARISPVGFKLDTTASATIIRSRFVHIDDSRARHNPALASMVFGSMPSSADLSPSSPQSEILPTMSSLEEQATSNILLNLDFEDLAFFHRQLEASHGSSATSFLTRVLEERESRRLRAVSNRAVANKQRMANSEIWDVAGFREHINEGALRRERVGFLLPTKPR